MRALEQALEHHKAGRLKEAEAAYRELLAREPEHADAWHWLGVMAFQAGRYGQAIELIERALARQPDYAEARNNLGLALRAAGHLDQAVAAYRQALAGLPDDAEVYNNLGIALSDQGEIDGAITALERAVALSPGFAEAHNNLGNALRARGMLGKAAHHYQRALELEPDDPASYINLATLLQDTGQTQEAVAACRRAIELKPDFAEGYANLGNALAAQGQPAEAVDAYRQALEHDPSYSNAHSNLFFCMHYSPAFDADAIFAEARSWNTMHAQPLAAHIRAHDNDRSPDRRLRIGYVSANLRAHPVGWFFAPVLGHHDSSRFEIFCYSATRSPDFLTAHCETVVDQWRDTARMDDAAQADRIRQDHVDILVDLDGHAEGNRLLTFARKPAPVQVTAGGHYDTTGLDAIDYLIADGHHAPPGAERYFSEILIRMPRGYVCYAPPDYAPAVTALPALDQGHVTFGCFNNIAKIAPQVVTLWAQILEALPDARLKLQTHGLSDPATRTRYRALFAAEGIDTERLALNGKVTHSELFAQYGNIDIALDPFPYSGGLTTCEALWMGVPVITLTGYTFAGRHATSHLTNVGLTECITQTPEDYIALASALARDLDRLSDMRQRLRAQMQASPLCDINRYTRDLEAAYRQMWKKYCEKSVASSG